MNRIRFSFFLRSLWFFAGMGCLQAVGVAQSSLSLSSSLISSDPSITGELIIVELAYACAGTVADCDGSVLTVDIPVGLDYVGLNNSGDIASSSYDSGTREVTFTFVDPLLAGTSGTVRVQCRFPLGDTPHNFVATLASEISSSSTVPASETSSSSVTSQAVAKPAMQKTLAGSAAINTPATFKVEFCNAEEHSARFGSLNFSNVRIEDVLPVGATFISGGTVASGVVTTYDSGTRTITTTIGNLNYGDCIDVFYTVEYPTPAFALGNTLTNTAEVFFTPVGQSESSVSDDATFTLENPSWSVLLNKSYTPTGALRQGQFGQYQLDATNSGSSPLTNFALLDTIPDDVIVISILSGQWFEGPGVTSDDLTIEYQTNLNSSWAAMPPNPMSIGYSRRIYVSDLGLAPNERITILRWSFASYTTTFDVERQAFPRVYFRVAPTATVGSTVTNCLTYTTTSSGANPALDENCTSFNVIAAETQPVLDPVFSNLTSSPRDIGEESRLIGYLSNEDITIASLSDFWGACVLPKGFDVNMGTISILYNNAFEVKPNPVISVTPNFSGTENTLFKVDWTGTGATLDPGETISVNFYASPNEFAPAGSSSLTWYMGGNETSVCASGISSQADALDVNGNGNTAEQLCYSNSSINVVPRINTQAELEVKGALDTDWTKFPANGETLPGGLADYQISVRNTGNVALEDVILLDILPSVGDLGVIDPQARLSEWSPNLAGPVNAPAGVAVEYSTATNPCRAADGFLASDPGGCQAPNWTALPPADITQVKSIRFLFGSTRIEPQTEFSFSWPMRTPVNVFSQPGVVAGDIAWNSYGIVANRADNGTAILPAEPVKTGIALNALIPGVIGDYVWIDADNDGIQDVGESGFDGTRVELYRDNGDGSADPAVDEFVDFTVTADGGYYLFPNLPAGDYFVWFVKPPAYNLSPVNQGADDALDSDATSYTRDGIVGALTPVVSITATDFEYSLDFGVTPSGLGAVGNYAWIDRNGDGIQNESLSDGANGIDVILYTSGGIYVNHTFTANNSFGHGGYYLFDDVAPGNYFMIFNHPTTPTHTLFNVGDDSMDSDVNPADSRTAVFTVLANTYQDVWDGGFSGVGPEDCNNGVDDDLDGFIDCLDEECPNGNAATRVLGL